METNEPAIPDGDWLLIGFSFGLTPDGSPGVTNREIARRMFGECLPAGNAINTGF
jgi:hypothetical protein